MQIRNRAFWPSQASQLITPKPGAKHRCGRSGASEIAHQYSLDRASLVFAASVVCVLLSLGLACAKRSLHDLG